MATQSPAGQQISQTAKAEGGSASGSASAQMQSDVTRAQNFEQAAQDVTSKMQTDPQSVSKQDAAHLESKEHKVLGYRPESDSISADAKRVAAANEQGRDPLAATNGNGSTGGANPATQSHNQKEQNFQDAVAAIKPKMENDPASVTAEDANLLRSREVRAHGAAASLKDGGIAAQAQHIVSENKQG